LKNGKLAILPNEEINVINFKYAINTNNNIFNVAFQMESKSENINRNENETIINITANSEAQRKLIDDLINVDFVEIKPAQLPATNNDIEDELPFNDNTNNSI
jgi:hypothetical protein